MTGKKTLAIRRKVTRMVAALVFAFIICWLPHHIFMLAKIPGKVKLNVLYHFFEERVRLMPLALIDLNFQRPNEKTQFLRFIGIESHKDIDEKQNISQPYVEKTKTLLVTRKRNNNLMN